MRIAEKSELNELCNLTLTEAKEKLLKKQISSVELTNAFIDAIEKRRYLNAYITNIPEIAIEQAKKSDKKLAVGEGGILEGLPLAIKDLFCTKNIRTTCASKMLENFIPPYESTVTQNLLDEGAVFLGKTNMDEFAMGSANLTSYFGPVINPLKSSATPNIDLVPGGSSGGSAAAVAANIALSSIGSDTGGSIRQPASFTGTVAMKPTYGLCSRHGMIAFASSLDQAGPISKTVRDCALMLSVMAGYDNKDSTSLNVKVPNYYENLNTDIKGITIGLPKECFENLSEDLNSTMMNSIRVLQTLGVKFVDISLKTLKYALPTYYIIAPAEASSNLARYDGVRFGFRAQGADNITDMYMNTRSIGFGPEVIRRIFIGTYVLSAESYDSYYLMAQKVKQKIIEDFEDCFKNVDLIMTPTTAGPAFSIEKGPCMSPVEMFLNDIFTVPVNMAGLPAVSVPAGETSDNLPLGIQFIGEKLSEQSLFNVAAAFEDAMKENI